MSLSRPVIIGLPEFKECYEELIPYGTPNPESLIREFISDANGLYICCEQHINGQDMDFELISHAAMMVTDSSIHTLSPESAAKIREICSRLLYRIVMRVTRLSKWSENHYYPTMIDIDGAAGYSNVNIQLRINHERTHTKSVATLYGKVAKKVLRIYVDRA